MWYAPFKNSFSFRDTFFGSGGIVFLLVCVILSIGLLFIHSASYHFQTETYRAYAEKQLTWVMIVAVPFFVLVWIDYRWLLKNSFWIYAFGIVLLLVTMKAGAVRGGARRWLQLGPVMFQTSDFVKLAVILILARILAHSDKQKLRDLFLPFAVTMLPMGLILIQPDMGTSLVLFPILFVMLFVSGVKIRHLVLVVLILANTGVAFYFIGLKDYQRKRINTFLLGDKVSEQDKIGDAYHQHRAKTAHGTGGWVGMGYQQGIQTRKGYLPERHTDFIFSVVGEEWGFLGTSTLLLLYLLLYSTMLIAAYFTLSLEGQLVIVGVVALLSFQTFVNTAMTVGFAPVTGLPLPFMSYGGTSLLFSSVGIALTLSVKGHENAPKARSSYGLR